MTDRPGEYAVLTRVFDDRYRLQRQVKHLIAAELRCARPARHLVGVAVRFPQWGGTWAAVRHPDLGWLPAWLDGDPDARWGGCACAYSIPGPGLTARHSDGGRWYVPLEWLAAQHGVVLTSDLLAFRPT